ncbi:MAG: hypothetical protein JXB32_04255 [Deltaproteobacteria bacterium]|nr:hypothetical protein [Deltaproteobacteria bacterium]
MTSLRRVATTLGGAATTARRRPGCSTDRASATPARARPEARGGAGRPGRSFAALGVVALLLAFPAGVSAQRKLPYEFDPELAEDPAAIRDMNAEYSRGLPDLPLEDMTEVELAGPVHLWLFHEAAGFLERLVATDRSDFAWPADAGSCAAHEAFEFPADLRVAPSAECLAAHDGIAAALAALDACREAAEPERYVLGYPPGVVNDDNTNDVLDLIGVMGSTLTEFPPLYDGVLPAEFVPRLRDVLRKLRHETLLPRLHEQLDSFGEAARLLDLHRDCFDPEARARLAAELELLVAEATAQRAALEALLLDGEREYRREVLRLGAISRSRPELPHPALTQADREFLAFWIGGVYWRLRGGGFVLLDGTQDARRLGLRRPFGALGELNGLADGREAADGVYCEIFEGWGEWFDMGTTPGQQDKYYDLVRMTRRGYEQIRTAVSGSTLVNPCLIPDSPFVLTIAGLSGKGYDTTSLYAGGLSMGPCYYHSWDQLRGWTWARDMEPPYKEAIDGPTAIGEVCTGGSIGLGLIRVLLFGRVVSPAPYAGLDAVFADEPGGVEAPACASRGEFARVTVVPLDAAGAPLPPGQEVAVVERPPYVVGGGVESFTDPFTGVTEYTLEVGSDRCSPDVPHEVRIRVGETVLREMVAVRFTCPPVAEDGVRFVAEPPEVAADGRSAAVIRLEATDACGNPAFGRSFRLEAFGDAPAVLSSGEATTGDEWGGAFDGVAQVEALSSAPGAMGLAATLEGTTFRSLPGLVTFLPAAPADDEDAFLGDADGGEAGDADGGDAGPAVSPGSGCSCTVPAAGRGAGLGVALPLLAVLCRRRRTPATRRLAAERRSRAALAPGPGRG